MKLKYFLSFFALVALLSSCSDDDTMTLLDEIKVSSSYVGINVDGGSNAIVLTAGDSWSFDAEEIPDWLTVSPMNGQAGEYGVTFTAPAAPDGRTAVLHVECGGKTQTINVIQGLAVVQSATCAEVLEGPESKTYRVTGTVKSIVNTTYGNWYLADETGEVYIYGTLDAKGNTKNFLSLGLEVGDVVTVEGPKTVYNGTVELVDVTVINIQKSLVKVESIDPEDATIPVEGGDVAVDVSCKTGYGVSVVIPDEAKDWLSIASVNSGPEGSVITFHAAANTGGDRNCTVTFESMDGASGQIYSAVTTIYQKGSIIAATVADFLAAEVGETQYRMTGVVQELYEYKGNVQGFYVRDYTNQIALVYKPEGFTGTEAKVGDIVTVVGKRGAYKENPQMVSGVLEEVKPVTAVTIDELLDMEDASDVYYMVTGTVTEIVNPTYGNLYLEDETNSVYVYGCYPGWGATGDNRKNWLETAGIAAGDKLTVIGVKSTYNGTPQIANGIYFSHEKAGE